MVVRTRSRVHEARAASTAPTPRGLSHQVSGSMSSALEASGEPPPNQAPTSRHVSYLRSKPSLLSWAVPLHDGRWSVSPGPCGRSFLPVRRVRRHLPSEPAPAAKAGRQGATLHNRRRASGFSGIGGARISQGPRRDRPSSLLGLAHGRDAASSLRHQRADLCHSSPQPPDRAGRSPRRARARR
jgi:hypothetical protein